MIIKESSGSDLPALLKVEKQAFGSKEGQVIVELVKNLMEDPSARPLLSLVALEDQQIKGHILFTRAQISEHEKVPVSLLAPLAVEPSRQRKGLGGSLINEGMRLLLERGVELVFVLGDPDYYRRHGFKPAGLQGYEAPYPLAEEIAEAWMVRELKQDRAGNIKGKILCAESLNRPEYWQE